MLVIARLALAKSRKGDHSTFAMNTSFRSRSLDGSLALFATLAACITASAANLPTTKDQAARSVKSGDFVFSMLPKAFQKNPILDMTVYTEFTPYGRLQRAATPDNPVYYVAHDTGYKQLGWSVGEHPPKETDVERVMAKALATNGFLAATDDHKPSVAVFYVWGSHNKVPSDLARDFRDLVKKNTLERAILVGGKAFAANMDFAMEWGDPSGDLDNKISFLREQASEELYYVVASAYDYSSLAHGERKLEWRTTMTVTSAGLALQESLKPLIATAAPYFGRETHGPEIAAQRVSREGRVEIGTAKVVDDPPAAKPVPTPVPAPAKSAEK